ncbi:MAG: hypothetical protein HY567_04305 [Candidatus Kerfeldbacteria bacterium]|nr:hypothetical protein [Candidatus Kerfeldbacteria bacterium]
MPEHLEVTKEWFADLGTRLILVGPVLDTLEETRPDLWKTLAYNAIKEPTKVEFLTAAVNTGIDVATNRIPWVRDNPTFKRAKTEVLGQVPRAVTRYYTERNKEHPIDFEGFTPLELNRETVEGLIRETLVANVQQFSQRLLRAVRSFPTRILDTWKRAQAKPDETAAFFKTVSLLSEAEQHEVAWWFSTLEPRDQEVVREMLGTMSDIDSLRLLLHQPRPLRVRMLRALAKEGPLEDLFQGMGEAVDPMLDRLNTALEAESARLD